MTPGYSRASLFLQRLRGKYTPREVRRIARASVPERYEGSREKAGRQEIARKRFYVGARACDRRKGAMPREALGPGESKPAPSAWGNGGKDGPP